MSDTITNNKPPLSAVIKQAFINMRKEIHTTIPGRIVKFDHVKQSAEVQPLIKRLFISKEPDGSEKETYLNIPVLINVPVIFSRGGGWSITFPIKTGDECIVHFSERALDNWRKNSGTSRPSAWRMHDYSDAICEVGLSSEPNVIPNFNDKDMEIRNDTSDVLIRLSHDGVITIKSPDRVVIDTPLTEIKGNTTIAGTLVVDLTSTASDHISGNAISGKSHVHGGVVEGNEISEGPQ